MKNEMERLCSQVEDLKAETALREREESLRIANGAARIGTYVTNLEADKVYWSPELCDILGVQPGRERTNEEAYKVVHENDRERVLAAGRGGNDPDWDGCFCTEHRVVRPDGQVRWLLWRGRTIFRETESGRIPSKRIGACVDITERKQAEDALRESEERYRQIVESSTDAILVRSGEVVIYANPAALKLFRASRIEELVGKRYLDLVHPDDRAESAERVRKGRTEKWIAPPREHRILTLDGQAVHVESTGVPIQYKGETQIFGVFRDITERKRAEEALHESEEIFNSFMEHCPVYVFFKDETTRSIRLSRNYEQMLGKPIKYLLGKTVDQLFPPGLAKGMTEDDLSVIRDGKPIRVVEELNGRTFETTKFPISRAGKSSWLAGFTIDITERRNAEKKLEEGHRLMDYIIRHDPNAIAVFDKDLRYIFVSERYLDDYKVKERNIIGRHHYEVFPEMPERWKQVHQRVLAGAVERAAEDCFERLDGSVDYNRWECRPWYRLDGSVGGMITYTEVITERKLAEENLRETEKKYRELAESLPQVIFEVDLNGILKYVNQTGCQLFGYTIEEIAKGFNVLEAFIPEDRERVALDIMLNIQGQRLGRQDYTAVRKDGAKFPVGVHADRVMRGQTATGVKGLLIDLTETQRAEEEKRKLGVQLHQAQKMEAIGALAGGIAHDFNNILSAIIGYTELAMLNQGASSNAEELQQALIAAKRARDLVKQILAFSRQTDEEKMPVRVGLVAKEAVKFLRATVPATIDIKTHIDQKSGAVLANTVELHQIILNLCTNAVHAIGGQIGVLEVDVQDAEIDLSHKDHLIDLEIGPYVKISVKDTGYGMTPDLIKRIFDPYFTTKEKGVGTGLGLAVVHGIVKKSGGAIKVESEPGKGSTFHIYLPKVDLTASIKEEHSKPIVGGSERILFVDDEIMLVDIGQQALQRLGYNVVSRTSPIEALELFKAKPGHFDLVVTDQTMPGMTGEALAKELIRIRPDIPVIICTGYSQAIDHERAKQKGVKTFVMKPILINEIAAAVREVLDKE